jgi:hypothetical protein
MENRLTRALGCGDIPDLATYQKLTHAILTDNFLYKKLIEELLFERGPDLIRNMHRLELEAFTKRIQFVRKAPQIRIVWGWIPEYKTMSGSRPMLRAERYFGDSKTPEEKMFWDPRQYKTVEAFRLIAEPWTRTCVSSDAVQEYANWMSQLDPTYVADMREVAIQEAQKAQAKQGGLSGTIAEAVYTQAGAEPGYLTDNSKVNKAEPSVLQQVDDLLAAAQKKLTGGRK